MLKGIELYNTPDGQVCLKPEGEAMFILDESHQDIIQSMLNQIHELYPEAFKRLSENYSKSSLNKNYYELRMLKRFCRCNFGSYDTQKLDIDRTGAWHFEQVQCPLRGECQDEGIICCPVLKTKLSERELEIAKLLSYMSPEEVAEEFKLSVRTVYNHIQSIKTRLKIKTIAHITAWYKNNKL